MKINHTYHIHVDTHVYNNGTVGASVWVFGNNRVLNHIEAPADLIIPFLEDATVLMTSVLQSGKADAENAIDSFVETWRY
jgi:hypothetical protein